MKPGVSLTPSELPTWRGTYCPAFSVYTAAWCPGRHVLRRASQTPPHRIPPPIVQLKTPGLRKAVQLGQDAAASEGEPSPWQLPTHALPSDTAQQNQGLLSRSRVPPRVLQRLGTQVWVLIGDSP